MLNSGGLVIVNTPDSGSLYARIMGMKWHLIVPPEHTFLFSEKSMKELLEDHNLEIITITKIGKKFTAEYVVHTLYRWLGWGVWKHLLAVLSRHPKIAKLSFPINFRDNMFVIARKIS
jgi:hypothetical protein